MGVWGPTPTRGSGDPQMTSRGYLPTRVFGGWSEVVQMVNTWKYFCVLVGSRIPKRKPDPRKYFCKRVLGPPARWGLGPPWDP
jgi:hypothetical protein